MTTTPIVGDRHAGSKETARHRFQPCRARGRRYRGGARLLWSPVRFQAARQEQALGSHRFGRSVPRPAEGPPPPARRWPPFWPRGRRQGRGSPRTRGGGRQAAARPFPRFPRSLGQSDRDRRLRQHSVHEGAECAARNGACPSLEERKRDQGAQGQGHVPELKRGRRAGGPPYATSSAVAASSTSMPPLATTRPASSSTTNFPTRFNSAPCSLTSTIGTSSPSI